MAAGPAMDEVREASDSFLSRLILAQIHASLSDDGDSGGGGGGAAPVARRWRRIPAHWRTVLSALRPPLSALRRTQRWSWHIQPRRDGRHGAETVAGAVAAYQAQAAAMLAVAADHGLSYKVEPTTVHIVKWSDGDLRGGS